MQYGNGKKVAQKVVPKRFKSYYVVWKRCVPQKKGSSNAV